MSDLTLRKEVEALVTALVSGRRLWSTLDVATYLRSALAATAMEKSNEPTAKRSCNRHKDCDAGDREAHGGKASHCPGPDCGPACPPPPLR